MHFTNVLDPAMIIESPVDNTLPAGTALLVMDCRAVGLPAPSISWFKNGVQIFADVDHTRILDNSYEASDYGITFSQLQLLDLILKWVVGVYYYVVT